MENQLQVFEHKQLGKIRVVMLNGEPWFVGKDLAASLKYTNERKAIRDHVDDEDKRTERIGTPYGVQNMTVVNESGMYALIFGSKLEKAREFKHWVTFEVLPAIRKTGSYSLVAPVPALPARKSHAVIQGYACVYAPLLSDNTVKIGCSGNPRTRVTKIKRDKNVTVNDLYMSPLMPEKLARLVEWACHEKFSSRRIKGEFFAVPFAEVCAAIDKFVSVVTIASTKENVILALKEIIADKKLV